MVCVCEPLTTHNKRLRCELLTYPAGKKLVELSFESTTTRIMDSPCIEGEVGTFWKSAFPYISQKKCRNLQRADSIEIWIPRFASLPNEVKSDSSDKIWNISAVRCSHEGQSVLISISGTFVVLHERDVPCMQMNRAAFLFPHMQTELYLVRDIDHEDDVDGEALVHTILFRNCQVDWLSIGPFQDIILAQLRW